MATRAQFKIATSERRRRHFSDSFKIQEVRELETGKTKVSEICKQYEVSGINVYRWLNKFGTMKDKMIELAEDTYGVDIKKKYFTQLILRLTGSPTISPSSKTHFRDGFWVIPYQGG